MCPGVDSGYFSLDVTNNYYRFPGEVFAETFAQKRFPGIVPWQFDTNPPTQTDFNAIDLDVRSPWTAPTTSQVKGKFSRKGKDLRSTPITTPLDGNFEVRLKGPKKSNFDLLLLTSDGSGVFAVSKKKKSKEAVSAVLCGERSVRATVVRKKGAGKYKLTVKKP